MNFQSLDFLMFVIANAVNLLMVMIFLARAQGKLQLERTIGIVLTVFILPVSAAIIFNAFNARAWWWVILPLPLVLFLLLEFVLDYLLKLPFRRTGLLVPYLVLYYLALLGLVGYSFAAARVFGFITLGTYFLNLITSWYSLSKVGHGSSLTP